jgi:aryl carrier-like protein
MRLAAAALDATRQVALLQFQAEEIEERTRLRELQVSRNLIRGVIDSVPMGKVQHKLKLAGNETLEVYDYPGAYAQRFDGIDKGGGEKPADLQKIFQDNKRTVSLRMQQTEQVLEAHGTSNCRQLTPRGRRNESRLRA